MIDFEQVVNQVKSDWYVSQKCLVKLLF